MHNIYTYFSKSTLVFTNSPPLHIKVLNSKTRKQIFNCYEQPKDDVNSLQFFLLHLSSKPILIVVWPREYNLRSLQTFYDELKVNNMSVN